MSAAAESASMAERVEACPKRMVHGPCGGVTASGGCEVEPLPCPFVDRAAAVEWSGVARRARSVELGRHLVDFRPSSDHGETAEAIAVLGDDACVLLGDHLDDPPELRAVAIGPTLVAAGARVVATITARDRSPEDCAVAAARLLDAGVLAVHCVTGDHPAVRFGSGHRTEFHADSLELVAMVRSTGGAASVAESPASPPRAHRVERIAEKERAGADLVVLNHAGGPDDIESFCRSVRARGVRAGLVPPVPVVTDRASAEALIQFPGLVVDPAVLDRVRSASDGRAAGIAAAIDLAVRFLSGAFDTVNLSGSAGGASLHERCVIMREVIDGVGARLVDPG